MSERFVISVNGMVGDLYVRDSRPLAVKELERIGPFAEGIREKVIEFLEERTHMVIAYSTENAQLGWISRTKG